MNIGTAIKDLRKKNQLSQADLAEQCEMTQTALSQIENGLRRPNESTLKRIAEQLKVPEIVIYLLATDDSDVPKEKLEMFKVVFPNVKNMLLSILE
jgi:transcriptional regulator with XRE-family HTH domain